MRPIRLEMQAFESYLDKTVLDFSKLGTKGLYLIDGPTGAGKTTIFQAIYYALYGETLGGSKKEGNIETTDEDLRNNKAAIGKDTYVDLIFKEKDYIYHIYREPAQKKLAKKKTEKGYVESNSSVIFEKVELDGSNNIIKQDKISDKSKDAKDKIESLLGLDADQFEKTILIPQGKFSEVLSQTTEKRTEIFRSLFNTDRYFSFIGKLNKMTNEAKNKLSSELDYQKVKFENCKVDVLDTNLIDDKDNLEKSSSIEDKISFINSLISKYETLANEFKEKYDNAHKDVIKWDGIFKESKSYKINKELLKDLEEKVSKEKAQEIILKDNLNKLKIGEEKYLNYNNDAIKLKESLKSYDELEENEKKLDLTNKDVKDLENEKIKREKLLNELIESIANFSKELEKIKGDPAADLNLLNTKTLPGLSKLENLVKNCENYISELNIKKKEFDDFNIKMQEAAKAALKEIQNANDISEKYFANLAGELASKLEDNVSCPVCGSTHHPHKATLLHESVTKKAMEESKNKADNAQKNATALETKVNELKKYYEDLVKKIVESLKDYGAIDENSINDAMNKLKVCFKNQYDDYDNKEKELIKIRDLKNKLTDDLEHTKEIKSKDDIDLNNVKVKLQEKSTLVSTYQNNIDKLKSSLPYKTKKEVEEKINELSSLYNKYKNELEKTRNEFSTISNSLSEKNGRINTLKEQISEFEKKGYPEQSIIEEKLENAVKIEIESNQAYIKYFGYTNTNKDVLNDLESSYNKSKNLQKESDRLNDLNNVFSGRTSDNSKSTIEIYVQGKYLDRVLEFANKRLLTMTDNQFSMIRAEKAYDNKSTSGLDINIIDNQNLTSEGNRKVVTLSGGESFKAALSLALGLRDAVAASKGGVEIECMYIDEGFGTLDSDSLDKVIEVLMRQTVEEGNSLVGVISHVEELQSKISNKIKVYKDPSGNSHLDVITLD